MPDEEESKVESLKDPKNVSLVSVEAYWSMAVKIRDNDECVVCGRKEEIVVRLVEGQSIRQEDGSINMNSGITLCAPCNVRYQTDDQFRKTSLRHLANILEKHRTTRLNVEVNRDLYLKFQAMCRFKKTTISSAVRAFVLDTINEIEGIHDSN